MNVLNDYTRNDTKLIEGLRLNNNEQLVPVKSNLIQSQNNTLTVQTGEPIDLYIVRQSDSIPDFSLSNAWTQYPLNLHTILNGTGTYIIQITYHSVVYSGIMTYVDDTTADIDDEIPLHAGGKFYRSDVTEQKEGRLYAKIKASESTETFPYPSLFLASSIAETNANAHISAIKFRKLI